MKKAIIILVVLLILLFPISLKAKDGGTVTYFPITFVYRVTVYDRGSVSEGMTLKGTVVKIFGKTVYDNTEKTVYFFPD
jgi:hypothetical protein